MIWGEQNDITFAGNTAQYKYLGHETGNPPRWEIHDSNDLFANYHLGCVTVGDLGTGIF
jgi:hypothetical protein